MKLQILEEILFGSLDIKDIRLIRRYEFPHV